MKNILIVFILLLGQTALAKRDNLPLPTAESCESVLKPKSETMIDLNGLIITYDQQVYWHDVPVQLKTNDGEFKKNSRILLRLLINLADHPYNVLSTQDLFYDAWVKDKQYRQSPEQMVAEALKYIRLAFVKADPKFDAIRVDLNSFSGACWDDGFETVTAPTFPQVPDLQFNDFITKWKRKFVQISEGHRRMVRLLIERGESGASNKALYLAFRGAVDAQMPDRSTVNRVVNAELVNIRRAFRAVDSTFNHIQRSSLRKKKW